MTRVPAWLPCRDENGPASPELRRRSAWLLHGPDPKASNRIQGRGAMSRAQGGLPSVVLPSLVGNGKDPCMMTRLSGRHPYCDTQVTVWQRAGEGSPAVGFDCQRVAVWQDPINAGLRPPPSAADGIDRGLSDSRWLLIERRQGVADTRVHAAPGRESHRSCRRGRGAVPYEIR